MQYTWIVPETRDDSVPTSLLSRLIPRYAEPHRRYHTWSHIGAVFDACERISNDKSRQLALAIFFHDAIYDPLRSDNEERSADLCRDECARAGLDPAVASEACELILATKHSIAPKTERARVLVDADLSILGMEEPVFDAYEDAIRAEYVVVPQLPFATGRALIVRGFLDRECIFQTERGRTLWEEQAHKNLMRSFMYWSSVAKNAQGTP